MRLIIATTTAMTLVLASAGFMAAGWTPAAIAAEHGEERSQSGTSDQDHEASITQEERAMLEDLDPSLQQQVVDRLGPEQTVTGILETMIINAVSDRYPGAADYVPDIKNKNVEVVFENERLLVNVDPATLKVVDAKKM